MARPEASKALLQALAVCAELTQTDLSRPAAAVMAADLARYPEEQVLGALERCRRELRPRMLTISAVIERLDDGRPDPQEAWSILPVDEEGSVVWCEEMRDAYGVACPLIVAGDLIPARMAFLEAYRKAVQLARDAGKPVVWSFSPGRSKDRRELAILLALEKGRIKVDYAQVLLPYHREDEGLTSRLLVYLGREQKALPAPGGLRGIGAHLGVEKRVEAALE